MSKNWRARVFFLTLVTTISSSDLPGPVLSVGLIEIAAAFGVSISLAGQIRTTTSIVGIISALLIGVVSARFSYRKLLLSGLMLTVVSALLCSIAPTFSVLILGYSLMGIVISLVAPMIFAYLGEHYSHEERPKAVGTLAATRTVIYLIMVQMIVVIVGALGWRATFIILVAPLAILGLVATVRVLPDLKARGETGGGYLEGYKNVVASRSAVANLLGNVLSAASWAGGVVLYTVSFLRERHGLAREDATLYFSGMVVCVIVGNYVGGSLATRYGRKNTLVVTSLATGFLIVAYMNTPGLELTLLISILMSVLAGVILTCSNSLILEQIPSYRGTVTSANSAAGQLGNAVGAAIGGFALQFLGWGFMGIVLGALQILASIIYQIGVIQSEPQKGNEGRSLAN